MHPDQQVFIGEIPIDNPEDMEKFQAAMDAYHGELYQYINKLAAELGISDHVAMDVWYLRTRSRWTQDLEDRLIRAAKSGKPCPCVTSGEEGEWLTENGF
jgi:hypothetical protein